MVGSSTAPLFSFRTNATLWWGWTALRCVEPEHQGARDW